MDKKKPIYRGDLNFANKICLLADALAKHNGLKESRQQLGDFILRLWFCLFAEDYHIFGNGKKVFLSLFKKTVSSDGSNAKLFFNDLFTVLATKESDRAKLDGLVSIELLSLPFIEGDFFDDEIFIPEFNADAVACLNKCKTLNWTKVSIPIFADMLKMALIDPDVRDLDDGYTPENVIHESLDILNQGGVIDDYYSYTLEQLITNAKKVKTKDEARESANKFVEKIASALSLLKRISYFDPACGCGNLLSYAYRETRREEREILKDLRSFIKNNPYVSQLIADGHYSELGVLPSGSFTELRSCVDRNKFVGIEIDPWLVKVANLSMWMTEYVCDNSLSKLFDMPIAMKALTKSKSIVQGDALQIDWMSIADPDVGYYVFSHLPYVTNQHMTHEQKAQVDEVVVSEDPKFKEQYAYAVLVKLAEYMRISMNTTAQVIVPTDIESSMHTKKICTDLLEQFPYLDAELGITLPWLRSPTEPEQDMAVEINIGVRSINLIDLMEERQNEAMHKTFERLGYYDE